MVHRAVRGLAGAAICALAVALAVPATAQVPKGFMEAYERGQDAYKLGDYATARAEFDKARRIDPKAPGVYRWLAAVSFAEDNYPQCLVEAVDYLKLAPTGGFADDVRKLHERCRVALARPPFQGGYSGGGAVWISATAVGADESMEGCAIQINGIKSGSTRMPGPKVVPPGATTIKLDCPGYYAKIVDLDVLPGIVTDVLAEVELDPDYARPDAGDPTGPAPDDPTGWLIVVADTPAAEIVFDGKPVEPDATGKIQAQEGVYEMSVCAAGYECWHRRVRVVRGQKRLMKVQLKARAVRTAQRKRGYYFLGAAAALATSGVVFGYLQHDAIETAQDWAAIERRRPPPGAQPLEESTQIEPLHTRAEIDDQVGTANTFGLVSTVSFGAAAVALGASVYYFLQERPAERAGFPLPMAIGPLGRDGVAATFTTELDW